MIKLPPGFYPPVGWTELEEDGDVVGWTDGTHVVFLTTVENAIELDWLE